MPIAVLRPNTTTGGTTTGFDQTGDNLLTRINDGSTDSFVTQVSGGAIIFLHVDDSDDATNGTINGASIFVTHKAAAKGESVGQIRLYDFGTTSTIASENFTISNTEFQTFEVCSTTSVTPSQINNLGIFYTATSGGPSLANIEVRVDYNDAVVGQSSILLQGKIELLEGKIFI